MAVNFLVIRIHPDSPVDGGTFSSYLDSLQIKVFLAGSGTLPTPTSPGTAILLGETTINSTGLNLVQVPWATNTYVTSVSKLVAVATSGSGSDFGKSLDVQALSSQQNTVDATGIAFGSVVVCPADTSVFANNTGVSIIPEASNPATLTLNQTIPKFVAKG